MKWPALIAVLGTGLLVGPGPAFAEDSMRCGTRLASTGDAKHKVRTLCGEPADVSIIGAMHGPSNWYDQYNYDYFNPAWMYVPVEVWTYNFGPNKLLRKLRFVGEELVEIRTDGYGY